MVPESVLVAEKLGQNDAPGAVDTVVDDVVGSWEAIERLDGDLDGAVEGLLEGDLVDGRLEDGRLDGDLDGVVEGLLEGDLVDGRLEDGRLDGDLVGFWDGRFKVGLGKVDGRLVGAADFTTEGEFER